MRVLLFRARTRCRQMVSAMLLTLWIRTPGPGQSCGSKKKESGRWVRVDHKTVIWVNGHKSDQSAAKKYNDKINEYRIKYDNINMHLRWTE